MPQLTSPLLSLKLFLNPLIINININPSKLTRQPLFRADSTPPSTSFQAAKIKLLFSTSLGYGGSFFTQSFKSYSKFSSAKPLGASSKSSNANMGGYVDQELNLFSEEGKPKMASGEEPTSGLAQRLWQRCRKEACFALYHPFVVGLAAGTLRIESFQHYVAQDAFFLRAFAKAYGMAEENTDDITAKEKLHQLQLTVYEELQLHQSYAKAWNVDLTKYASPHSATMSYVGFLLSTAAGKLKAEASCSIDSDNPSVDLEKMKTGIGLSSSQKRNLAAYTLAAMVPCMRLYAFLGQEISKSVKNHDSHPFEKWISTYSSADFKASTLQIEELLDQLAMELNEEEHAKLERLFRQAMILEAEFFDAQPSNRAQCVPLVKDSGGTAIPFVLITDFDSTCSVSDSCPALANLSIACSMISDKGEEGTASRPNRVAADLSSKWETVITDYTRGYNELYDQLLPDNDEFGDCGRPFEYEKVKLALGKFSHFELDANLRLEKLEVLKNINMEDVKNAGRKMPLFLGCSHLFTRIQDNYDQVDADVHILSACWSQTFLEGCLSQGGIKGLSIYCNELESFGGKSNGKIMKRVQTALDKERIFLKIIESRHESVSPSGTKTKELLTIFIGDSLTDLLCLLRADVGILIGQNSYLSKFAHAFGITLLPLYEGLLKKESSSQSRYKWEGGEGILYTVADWHEIEAFLLGFHQKACKL